MRVKGLAFRVLGVGSRVKVLVFRVWRSHLPPIVEGALCRHARTIRLRSNDRESIGYKTSMTAH